MPREHFTVGDVDALVPALERIFVDVLQLRAGLRALEIQLERANVRMSNRPIRSDHSSFLVHAGDFPSERLGEEIVLCWRFGEKKVGFWHPVDGGFASRRPVDADVASAQPPAE